MEERLEQELGSQAVKVMAALFALTAVVVTIAWAALASVRPPEPALRTDLGPAPRMWTPTPGVPTTASVETSEATISVEATETSASTLPTMTAGVEPTSTTVAELPPVPFLPGSPWSPIWPGIISPVAPGPYPSAIPTTPPLTGPGPVAVVPPPPVVISPTPQPTPDPVPTDPTPGKGRGRGRGHLK